jgi:transcription elongation factor GreA
MPEKPIPLTRDGLKKIEAELDHLQEVRRREVAERIHLAKESGLTQNDPEYDDAKNEQAAIEGRILELEVMLKRHTLIDEELAHHSSSVRLGSTVVVTSGGREQTYTIVGSTEADPSTGRISNESPVGRALIGRRVGDSAQAMTPKGVMTLTVTEIR